MHAVWRQGQLELVGRRIAIPEIDAVDRVEIFARRV